MKKRITVFLLAGAMMLSTAACGSSAVSGETENQSLHVEETGPAPEASQEAEVTDSQKDEDKTETSEENVGIANPWRKASEEDVAAAIGRSFIPPEGATDLTWRIMDSATAPAGYSAPMVELIFTYDGLEFNAREQVTGDTAVDISGMYYDWTVSDKVTLANWGWGNMTGNTYRYVGEDEYVDLCTWYDVEYGASYSLSVASPDLDGFDIQAVAEAMCDPEVFPPVGESSESDEQN